MSKIIITFLIIFINLFIISCYSNSTFNINKARANIAKQIKKIYGIF